MHHAGSQRLNPFAPSPPHRFHPLLLPVKGPQIRKDCKSNPTSQGKYTNDVNQYIEYELSNSCIFCVWCNKLWITFFVLICHSLYRERIESCVPFKFTRSHRSKSILTRHKMIGRIKTAFSSIIESLGSEAPTRTILLYWPSVKGCSRGWRLQQAVPCQFHWKKVAVEEGAEVRSAGFKSKGCELNGSKKRFEVKGSSETVSSYSKILTQISSVKVSNQLGRLRVFFGFKIIWGICFFVWDFFFGFGPLRVS